MTSLKSQVGTTSSSYDEKVSADLISAFYQALGVPEKEVAPPTFLTRCRKGEFELFQKLKIDLTHILHAEQEYQYEGALKSGDVIHYETVLTQVLEKQGSKTAMQFVTLETQFRAQRNSESFSVGKAKTTIVVR